MDGSGPGHCLPVYLYTHRRIPAFFQESKYHSLSNTVCSVGSCVSVYYACSSIRGACADVQGMVASNLMRVSLSLRGRQDRIATLCIHSTHGHGQRPSALPATGAGVLHRLWESAKEILTCPALCVAPSLCTYCLLLADGLYEVRLTTFAFMHHWLTCHGQLRTVTCKYRGLADGADSFIYSLFDMQ